MKTVGYVRIGNIYDESRTTKEILALLDSGYNVHVFGWNRNGKAKTECEKVFSKYKGRISYSFYEKILSGRIGFKNLKHLYKWIKWAYKELCKIKPDIIHSCDFEAGVVGKKYCKKHNCYLVYDIFDYYIDSHNIPRIFRGIVERKEHSVINCADSVIICTEERMEQIYGTNPKKIIVVHNSPDVENLPNSSREYDYVYCGGFYELRLIKEIMDRYDEHQNLKFAFAGSGDYEKEIEDLGNKYANFKFFGTMSYSDVISLEKKSLVLSAIYEPSIRNHRLCAPNKFYEALALGKPIIVCRGTGIDKIVEKEKIGFVINYDADEFYNAVEYYINNIEESVEIGFRARKLYDEKYSWKIMRNRLIDMYNELGVNVI